MPTARSYSAWIERVVALLPKNVHFEDVSPRFWRMHFGWGESPRDAVAAALQDVDGAPTSRPQRASGRVALTPRMREACRMYLSVGGVHDAFTIVEEARKAGMPVIRGDTIHQAEQILADLGTPKRYTATGYLPDIVGTSRRTNRCGCDANRAQGRARMPGSGSGRYSKARAAREWKVLGGALERYLLGRGAVPGGYAHGREYTMSTPRGPFRVIIFPTDPISGDAADWLTVYGRWDDVKKAPHDANPYSGKWNLHAGKVSEGATGAETFERWKRMFEGVIREH